LAGAVTSVRSSVSRVPSDWTETRTGEGWVDTTVINSTADAVVLRLSATDTTVAQVALPRGGEAHLWLFPMEMDSVLRLTKGGRNLYFRGPKFPIASGASQATFTLSNEQTSNLTPIDVKEFDR
jgi:hypothetical protein